MTVMSTEEIATTSSDCDGLVVNLNELNLPKELTSWCAYHFGLVDGGMVFESTESPEFSDPLPVATSAHWTRPSVICLDENSWPLKLSLSSREKGSWTSKASGLEYFPRPSQVGQLISATFLRASNEKIFTLPTSASYQPLLRFGYRSLCENFFAHELDLMPLYSCQLRIQPEKFSTGSSISELLTNFYVLKNYSEIIGFVNERPLLISALLEAYSKIREYFGYEVDMILELTSDPDDDHAHDLFVRIVTSMPFKEALGLLDRLDAEWWLDASTRARDLNITVESL